MAAEEEDEVEGWLALASSSQVLPLYLLAIVAFESVSDSGLLSCPDFLASLQKF